MKRTIIIIEDDAMLREELADYLAGPNRDIQVAGTLVEARRLCMTQAPVIVLSDIRLPDGDGVSFCIEMAEKLPGTKWVLMSGNRDLVRLGNMAHTNAFAVIDKPVPPKALERFVASALGA
jgi:two-component system response regulator HydG